MTSAATDATFSLTPAPSWRATPLVFASPHSGRLYPDDMMAAAALDAHAIRRSEDAFVDELIECASRHGAAHG